MIVGAGGIARSIAGVVEEINDAEPAWELLGFVDDAGGPDSEGGFPVLGPISHLEAMDPKPYAVIGVGDPGARRLLAGRLEAAGVRWALLLHPSTIFSRHSRMGAGSIVTTLCRIDRSVTIGRHCLILSGCLIGHDTRIDDFASLMPGVKVAGDSRLGAGCFIGINACVVHGVGIGEWSTIGAGAAVVSAIPAGVVAAGVPARVIKEAAGNPLRPGRAP